MNDLEEMFTCAFKHDFVIYKLNKIYVHIIFFGYYKVGTLFI